MCSAARFKPRVSTLGSRVKSGRWYRLCGELKLVVTNDSVSCSMISVSEQGEKQRHGSIFPFSGQCVVFLFWFCFHSGLSSLNSCYNLSIQAETHLQTKFYSTLAVQSEIRVGKQTGASEPRSAQDGWWLMLHITGRATIQQHWSSLAKDTNLSVYHQKPPDSSCCRLSIVDNETT